MSKDKTTHGGARKGAGRKNHDKVRITATITKSLGDKLAREANKSAVVEVALEKYYEDKDDLNKKTG